MINFPDNPNLGDKFTDSNGQEWLWNGELWHRLLVTGGVVSISDAPPSGPVAGDIWMDSKTGLEAVWYEDGTSGQWVSDAGVEAPVSAAQTTYVTDAPSDGSSYVRRDNGWVKDAGMVAHFAMQTAPSGWLEADGSTISRTTYAALFTAIGDLYGIGDGSTTFEIPDLRGEFIRGWDNDRGIDIARAFGSSQLDELAEHSHTLVFSGRGYSPGSTGTYGVTINTINQFNDSFTNNAGGVETRPKNIAMLPCIKY